MSFCDHSTALCHCVLYQICRSFLDVTTTQLVEFYPQEFLYSIVSIYHPDNGAGTCEDKRAREGMEDGSFLPGRVLFGGTSRGTHLLV